MDRFKRVVLLRVDKRKRVKEALSSFSPLALSNIYASLKAEVYYIADGCDAYAADTCASAGLISLFVS